MKTKDTVRTSLMPGLILLALATGSATGYGKINQFKETDLVSDIPGRAQHTDPNLVNPWGLSASGGSPMWVSNNGTGTSTIYNGVGTPAPLVVTIPGGAPTGQVRNGGSGFNGDSFLFASEAGVISGWRGALGTTAETLFNMSTADAIYKGLAFGSIGTDSYLYAANFHSGGIDVFKGTGAAPTLTGSFLDPLLPAGYAPFNVQNLGNKLYVTYALQDADAEDDIPGAGHGFVDTFDLNGNFLSRFASGGVLDSPWGLALAPSGFGPFAGDLLVGNFGDGRINAFNATTGSFIDALRDVNGDPLSIDGLWGLRFGNGGGSGPIDTLYFAAGIAGPDTVESHGLYGSIHAVPEPATYGLIAAGALLTIGLRRRLRL